MTGVQSLRLGAGSAAHAQRAQLWQLSNHYLRAHFPRTELWADDAGAAWARELGLRYDAVRPLPPVPVGCEDIWSMGKLQAASGQEGPFVHVDGDVFWRCEPISAPFLVQSEEKWGYRLEDWWDRCAVHPVPRPSPVRMYNHGVFGGAEWQVITEACRTALRCAEQGACVPDKDAPCALLPESAWAAARAVAECLVRHGLQCAVIGAAAMQVHGRARRTGDVDMAVVASWPRLRRAIAELVALGFSSAVFKGERHFAGAIRLTRREEKVDVINFAGPAMTLALAGIHAAQAGPVGVKVMDLHHLIALKLWDDRTKGRIDCDDLLPAPPSPELRELCARHGLQLPIRLAGLRKAMLVEQVWVPALVEAAGVSVTCLLPPTQPERDAAANAIGYFHAAGGQKRNPEVMERVAARHREVFGRAVDRVAKANACRVRLGSPETAELESSCAGGSDGAAA